LVAPQFIARSSAPEEKLLPISASGHGNVRPLLFSTAEGFIQLFPFHAHVQRLTILAKDSRLMNLLDCVAI